MFANVHFIIMQKFSNTFFYEIEEFVTKKICLALISTISLNTFGRTLTSMQLIKLIVFNNLIISEFSIIW